MNYVELINRFWVAHEANCFTTCEIALYFYLLKVNNASNWRQFFKRNNAKIMADLGVKDRRTLECARNRLKQAGLIDYQKKSTNPNVTYSFTSAFNAQVDAQASVQVDVQVDAQDMYKQVLTKDKHKYKQKEIPPLSPKMGDESASHAKELDTGPIDELCFENVWNLYDKKQDKKKAEAKWNKLSIENKRKALAHIPKYVQTTPDKQFRKNLTTYLNGECWDNELTFKTSEDETTGTHYREFD
ncbi:hypothetical protein [Parabacteroides pacaensis]|uniref:hypothetical protein n=1 Tax=Parabacteroides pacaensis TaxID=2086575 RepID=UPI000D0FE164|nr:hypothetical protein [Parabacteroides pacaensis]